jgi:predicted LPLAT superfamily acyltransferase
MSVPAGAPSRAPEWRRRPERGSPLLLRVMAWLSLRCGRAAARPALHLTAAYFFLFAPRARRHMRDYLGRALGRKPRAADRYRLILWFATTIQDRLFLLAGRHHLFQISLQGESLIRGAIASGDGVLLFGAHMGSFEVLRTIGDQQPGLRIAMAMYEDNARKLQAVMAAAKPRDPPEIIALGHIDAMLRIRERLDGGVLVGVLADRTLGDEPAVAVEFLGAPACLPLGAMRAAALLQRRVLFMLGLYRGGNRYHIVFEPLADFRQLSRANRAAAIEAAVVRYGKLLEQYCRSDPYNWFNFFDFWSSARGSADPACP